MSDFEKIRDKNNNGKVYSELKRLVTATEINFEGLLVKRLMDISAGSSRGRWSSLQAELVNAQREVVNCVASGEESRAAKCEWLQFVIHHAAIYAGKGSRNIIKHYNQLVDFYSTLKRYQPTLSDNVVAAIGGAAEDVEEAVTGCCGLFGGRHKRDNEYRPLLGSRVSRERGGERQLASDIANKYNIQAGF